jgi:ATP phosphoribosyltransferase
MGQPMPASWERMSCWNRSGTCTSRWTSRSAAAGFRWRRYFNQKGIPVEIIKLYGSIELAPVTGLAERIVDLVSSGKTLQAHHLVEVDVIAHSTARLIVNRASLKMKHASLTELIERMKRGRPKKAC